MKILICTLGFLFVNTFMSDYDVEGVTLLAPPIAAGVIAVNTWIKELQKVAKCDINDEKAECCITHEGDHLTIHKLCCVFIPQTRDYTIKVKIDGNDSTGATYGYGTSNEYCVKFVEFNDTQICAQNKRSNPESNNFRLGLILRIDAASELLVSVRFREMNMDKDKRIVLVDSTNAPTDVEFYSTINLMCNGAKKGVKSLMGSTEPAGSVTEYLEAVKLFCGWRDLSEKLYSMSCGLATAGVTNVYKACNSLMNVVTSSISNIQANSNPQDAV